MMFWERMAALIGQVGLEHRAAPRAPEPEQQPATTAPAGPSQTVQFKAGLVRLSLRGDKIIPVMHAAIAKKPWSSKLPKMPMEITLRGEIRYHDAWGKKPVACGFTNVIQTWNEGFKKYGTVVYNGRPPDSLHPGINISADGPAKNGRWEGNGRLGSLELEQKFILKGWGDDPRLGSMFFSCSPYATNSRYISARIERGDNDQLDNHHQESKISKRIVWKPRFWFEVNGKRVGLGELFEDPSSSRFEIVAVYYWGKPAGYPDGLKDVLEWFEDIPVIGWLEEKLSDFGNWLEDLF